MLRQLKSEPAFLRSNLIAALEARAVCEVDLRFTADGHALCVHDRRLDRETTGQGAVASATRAHIERLQQRGPDGDALASTPLFLDEVLACVQAHRRGHAAASLPAQLQLDVKVRARSLDASALARIAHLLAPCADACIASAAEFEVVQRLAAAAPGLHQGFDPLALYPRSYPPDAAAFHALAERTRGIAPAASLYYLEASLVLAGLDHGANLVALLGASGAEIDAWTIDADRPQLEHVLRRLLDAGVQQITSNDPKLLAPIIDRLCAA